MNGDENPELMVLRQGNSETPGSVTLYSVDSDGEIITAAENLSAGLESISKLNSGRLKDNKTGLFVEGTMQGGLVTDILVYKNGALNNVTLDPNVGYSAETFRNSTAAFRDLNEVGTPLVPIPRALNSQSETVYRVLDWYLYSSNGKRNTVCTTYHNYTDSWYLTLPDTWDEELTVRREDTNAGERGVVFSLWNDGNVIDFMAIYALSGENRWDMASKNGRFVLYAGSETIYVVELRMSRNEWVDMPDLSYLRKNFHLIYSEWIAQ